jgi:site-specific DNA recombinase
MSASERGFDGSSGSRGGLEQRSVDGSTVSRVPAAEIEQAVVDQLRGMLRAPEVIVATWKAARSDSDGLAEQDVRAAIVDFDPLWDELFPAEQARIIQLLVERVDVGEHGLKILLRASGLTQLLQDLNGVDRDHRRAAA